MDDVPVRITVGEETVSGLWQEPEAARAVAVLAHGAGADMDQPFLTSLAASLSARRFAVLRYRFPYREAGRGRPDRPDVATAAVRAAVSHAHQRRPDLPVFAGGKSFGGRMTSTAEAEGHLPGVAGLAFVGFPLHPSGRPSTGRAEHLASVSIPMLFLQGDRDALAELPLLEPVVAGLGPKATLKVFEGADHSFHVLKSSGTNDRAVFTELVDAFDRWASGILAS